MAVIFFFVLCPSPTLHFQKEGLCYNEPSHFTTDVSIKEIKEGCGFVVGYTIPHLQVCTSVLSLACGVPGRSAPGRDLGSGSSPPGAALWRERKKRWGCHCTTKRKTPWLTFPRASFVLDSAWVLKVLSSPSFSCALHTRPPAPLRADGSCLGPQRTPAGCLDFS